MKILKLHIALCSILFTTQTITAQHNILMVTNEGSVNAANILSVNYATFNANDKWFTITNDGIDGVKTNSITAICTFGLSSTDVKGLSLTPQVGICYSKDNAIPTINDNYLSLGSELKCYTFTLNSLAAGTTYYFRPYIKLANAIFYGNVATAKTFGTKPVDNSKTINGHKFIDLGLPSGLLWAESNIGAITAADAGDYFAWGETQPKEVYNKNTYKYQLNGEITKYNETDRKTMLDKDDDAAFVNWGDSCRMPINKDFMELFNSNNCTWNWTSMITSSGSFINGCKVTSNTTGNSIFLPAVGNYRETELISQSVYGDGGDGGYYWSSQRTSVDDALFLEIYNCDYIINIMTYRYHGLSIRPVAEP